MNFQLFRLINKSFGARIITYLSGVMIFVTGVFTFFHLNSQQTFLEKEMLKDGTMLVGIAANNSRLGIFANDSQYISESLKPVIDVEGVIGFCVYNVDGHLLQFDVIPGWDNSDICFTENTISSDFLSQLQTTPEVIFVEKSETFDFWTQVLAKPSIFTEEMMFFEDAETDRPNEINIIGFVTVVYDKTPIKENIRNILAQNILILFLFLIIGWVAIYFIVQRVTGPLKKFVQKMVSDTQVEYKDDLGVLTDTFSDMVKSLERSFATSSELKKGLEVKVEELRESEDKFRNISEGIADGVAIIQNGKLAWHNKAFSSIFGYESEELSYVETKSLLPQVNHMESYITGTEITSRYQVEAEKKNNQKILIDVNAQKVVFDKENAVQLIIRDVTQLDRAEKKRKELEVKALGQSKLASLGKIAASVAHEINQPLSFIKIAYESLLRDLDDRQHDPEEMKGYCIESLRQVDRITSITTHLRSFGKVDDSMSSDIQLPDILDNSLILMGESLRLANITIEREIDKNLLPVKGNNVKLEQVFINLFQNSYDAMAKYSEKKIMITMRQAGEMIEIWFADSGPGISPEEVENIFEPFFTTKRLEDRTGLGLGIINNIIKEHGGTIEYRKREGWGASFLILLPESTKIQLL